MDLDVNNFEQFTYDDHYNNLNRLGVSNYKSLIGEEVFFSRPEYGTHKVVDWDKDKGEFLLEIDDVKF